MMFPTHYILYSIILHSLSDKAEKLKGTGSISSPIRMSIFHPHLLSTHTITCFPSQHGCSLRRVPSEIFGSSLSVEPRFIEAPCGFALLYQATIPVQKWSLVSAARRNSRAVRKCPRVFFFILLLNVWFEIQCMMWGTIPYRCITGIRSSNHKDPYVILWGGVCHGYPYYYRGNKVI